MCLCKGDNNLSNAKKKNNIYMIPMSMVMVSVVYIDVMPVVIMVIVVVDRVVNFLLEVDAVTMLVVVNTGLVRHR